MPLDLFPQVGNYRQQMSDAVNNISTVWPVIKNIAVSIGALRVAMHPVNVAFDTYVKNRVSPTQVASFHRLEGLFRVLDFIIHTITSISPASLNAAAQVYLIGDRDLKIQVPYKASGPLPPNEPPLEKNQVSTQQK